MKNDENTEIDSSADAVEVTHDLAELLGSPEAALSRYCKCGLCGSNLHFSHVTDFSRNITQETAKCPECGIRVRRIMHKLQ